MKTRTCVLGAGKIASLFWVSPGYLDLPGLKKKGACVSLFLVPLKKTLLLLCSRYPLDTGMFISSGSDKLLKIWDTNTLVVSLFRALC